ncbi:MAG: DNA-directed RNA polymerase subunit delta [Clostridia bacterium]|nr:DNA-directed RNA polymerase subunit delta [Clostridia bacterium]
MAMEESIISPKMSVGDIAYQILKVKGEPLYFRDLIGQVLSVKPINGRDLGHQMALVHTELNLDNRFIHIGSGMWSLREMISPRQLKQYDEEWEA